MLIGLDDDVRLLVSSNPYLLTNAALVVPSRTSHRLAPMRSNCFSCWLPTFEGLVL